MKRLLALFLFISCSAPALGQAVPLVVGSVRDQYGAAIAGAVVQADGDNGDRRTTTAADGTFALQVSGATHVSVTCAYCEPVDAGVNSSEPVVAIVRRYDALIADGPSPRDLSALPYRYAESALTLRPFNVLYDSSRILPGPRVADHGLSSAGGLLIDAGVPNYDIVTNASPFYTIPEFYEQSFSTRSPLQAFQYGDQAGAGTFFTDPRSGNSTDGLAISGNDTVFRAGMSGNGNNNAVSADASDNANDIRQRADGLVTLPVGDAQALALSASDARTLITPGSGQYFDGSFASAAARYDAVRENHLHASALADRGTYDTYSGNQFNALWSDVAGEIGIASNARVGSFANLGFRSSTGEYDAQSLGYPLLAATVGQQYLNAGVDMQSNGFDMRAGLGAYSVAYAGGVRRAQPLYAQIASPSLVVDLAPGQRFSATIGTGQSFLLPTLLQAYGNPPASSNLPYDINALAGGTVTYTDLRRLRVDFTAAVQNVRNFNTARVTAVGGAVVWQMAPAISLRAWTLHTTDSSVTSPGVNRLGALPQPATVGSVWLTYEGGAGIRFDAIWRRDLLDLLGNDHLDAAVSAPLARNLRWYVGTEQREHTRYVDVGVRFTR
ncbi:MAG: carboxypeptidase-like regulatory domain-containing protein [Vulcanimicrobiaceae bacterium]